MLVGAGDDLRQAIVQLIGDMVALLFEQLGLLALGNIAGDDLRRRLAIPDKRSDMHLDRQAHPALADQHRLEARDRSRVGRHPPQLARYTARAARR